MSFYSEIISKREENNIRLEDSADRSLREDRDLIRIETEVDDAQTAVLYILECFGIRPDRLYGFWSVPALLDTLLDPLGVMFEYSEKLSEELKTSSRYILAFSKDGKAVAITPGIMGYQYYCPSSSEKGYAGRGYISELRERCYVFSRPLVLKNTLQRTFVWNIFKALTAMDAAALLSATALVTALGLFLPYISRWVYKVYIGGASKGGSLLLTAAFMYISVVFARAAISYIKTLVLSSVKLRVSVEMQSAVMAKIMHLPHSFFRNTSSGRISRRIMSCSRLSDIIIEIFMDVLLNLSFAAVYLVQLKSFAPALFVPALVFIILRIITSYVSAVFNRANETRLLDLDMKYTGFLFSAIRGIQKIKGLGCETFVYSQWADMYRRKLALNYKQPFFLKYSTDILLALSSLTTIAMLFISMQNGLAADDYLTFVSSYTLIMTVVASLTDIMGNMLIVEFLSKNVEPVIYAENEESEALEYVKSLHGKIKAENIWFSYDNDNRGCLRGVSLDIQKGEKVAIVGESGCGKSTLLKILLGMEIPDSGNVYYDDKDMRSLNLKSLRRNIGSVFQFSRLFPGTIADNIAFGNEEEASDERIWEAADNAEIGDYIRRLALKMDTEISESNSSGFSGGQRQRLLIARAIMPHPRVLFLDEATSALDNITQAKVLENIRKMNCTIVMVAHRLSTVEQFDRIIMLEDGVIAEEGSYAELMEKDGKFANLVRKQINTAKEKAAGKK